MANVLSAEELAALPQKTKQDPNVVALYASHDFLEAYAMHTDMRVEANAAGAVGAAKDWENHGYWQRDFLISQGLLPRHRLLEVGSGTGRLARKVVPYLEAEHYVAAEISDKARDYSIDLSCREGWVSKNPLFYEAVSEVPLQPTFDYVWAFSVFIHLPSYVMLEVFAEVAARMDPDSRFYFSYVPEAADSRTGLKQFRHTLATYKRACRHAGLSFQDVPWMHEQRIALARLAG